MAYNFPNTPSEGQIFTPPGGPTYVYAAGTWKFQAAANVGGGGGGGGASVTISDTAPATPKTGDMWWESDTGNMFVYYADADSSQWVQVTSNTPPTAQTAQTRNRIVNGAMQISQENGNTAGAGATGTTYYPADQFAFYWSSTGALTTQRVQSYTPNGSVDRIRLTVTTADTSIAATEVMGFNTRVEGVRIADFRYGTASARQVILRFGVKAPAGTYAVSVRNSAYNRSYVAMFTIAAGQANTDTEQVLVIPGDTTGTWATDNTLGMEIWWTFMAGSTYSGGAAGWQAGSPMSTAAISNGMATVNNVFELFDVGLYLDPQSTGVAPPWGLPDVIQETENCKRYFQQLGILYSANVTSGTTYYATKSLVTSMRANPSISGVATGGVACFPNAAGSLSADTISIQESRVANGTAGGAWSTSITVNARM